MRLHCWVVPPDITDAGAAFSKVLARMTIENLTGTTARVGPMPTVSTGKARMAAICSASRAMESKASVRPERDLPQPQADVSCGHSLFRQGLAEFLYQRSGAKISVTIVSSEMPAPAAFGCCAPDFGSPYI